MLTHSQVIAPWPWPAAFHHKAPGTSCTLHSWMLRLTFPLSFGSVTPNRSPAFQKRGRVLQHELRWRWDGAAQLVALWSWDVFFSLLLSTCPGDLENQAEVEEKTRLINQVLELQHTLEGKRTASSGSLCFIFYHIMRDIATLLFSPTFEHKYIIYATHQTNVISVNETRIS